MDLIPDFIKNNSLLSSADSNFIAHLANTRTLISIPVLN